MERSPPLSSNYSVCAHSLAKHLAQTPGLLQLYDVIQNQELIEQVDISNTEQKVQKGSIITV